MATKKSKSSKSATKRGSAKKSAAKKGTRKRSAKSTKVERLPAPAPIGSEDAGNIAQTGQTPLAGNAPALPTAPTRTTY